MVCAGERTPNGRSACMTDTIPPNDHRAKQEFLFSIVGRASLVVGHAVSRQEEMFPCYHLFPDAWRPVRQTCVRRSILWDGITLAGLFSSLMESRYSRR